MRRFLILLWSVMALVQGLPAQALAEGAPPPAADPGTSLVQARADLHAVASTALSARGLSDADIQARLGQVEPIDARLTSILATLNQRLGNLQTRQSELGAAPGPGAPAEDPATAQARRDLGRATATLTAETADARLLILTADQVSASLSDRLRENFAARLWARTRSILDPGLWKDFAGALPADLRRLDRAMDDEIRQAGRVAWTARDLLVAALALAASLSLIGPGRITLDRVGYRRAAQKGTAGRLRRIVLALWLVGVAIAAPLVAGLVLWGSLTSLGALTPAADRLALLALRAGVFAAFLGGLGRALLSPGRPEWRLAPVPDDMVARLAPYPGLIGGAAALSGIVAGLNSILGSSLASRVASDCVAVLIELLAICGALVAVGRARSSHADAAPDSGADRASIAAAGEQSRLAWILATLATWLALGGALVAVLVGYLALASFITRETVWIAAVLALLSLGLRLADDAFPSLLSPRTAVGRSLGAAVGLSQGQLEQIGVLLSGLARLFLLLVAWVAVVAPFGATPEDLLTRLTATDFVVRLGLVSISPGAVLGGLALFLAGLALTRAVRRWLELRYLPKTSLDVGLRTSLAAGVTYLGVLVAVLAAFAYLGLSLAQIALFASALSVGIGFGLQAIIGNFVSGLILLAERPIQVGDWIAIGDLEGDVRKISIRATEIEMMDRSRLIVPNSDLVSKTVRNVTHTGALGRVRIILKVAPTADPAKVRALLLARLAAHPKALKEPAPSVYLTDARDGAIEFTAFAYVASPRLAYAVKSDLLFEIIPALNAAGIALATPGTVVNVGLPDHLPEPSPEAQ